MAITGNEKKRGRMRKRIALTAMVCLLLVPQAALTETTTSKPASPSLRLRSSYRALKKNEVRSILKSRGFFSKEYKWNKEYSNPNGRGILHHYERKSIAGDCIVMDHATGLMWHQSGSDGSLRYKKAQEWLDDLNRRGYAGYSDWRLPTLEEGASLLENSEKNGNLYIDPVFSSKQSWIWTGDFYSTGGSWVVDFGLGYVDGYSRGARHCARPVRSGK